MNIVVIEPSLNDDFDKFYLTPPVVVSGGSYFTRILYNMNYRSTPVFLHVPVCTAQKGYVKSGRRSYMDLMLNNSETVFVQWMENMESRCRALLYEKQDVWFDNKLEKDDIENAFNTCMKLYRSGKNIVLRVNVPASTSVFDESGETRTCETIDASTSFTSIIEVRGIKFSENAFQLELEMKQVMAVPSNPFSSKCFLKQGVLSKEVVANANSLTKQDAPASGSGGGAVQVGNEWIASAAAFLKSRAPETTQPPAPPAPNTFSSSGGHSTHNDNETDEVQLVMEGDEEEEDVRDMEIEGGCGGGDDGEFSFRIEKNEVDLGDLLESDDLADVGEGGDGGDSGEVVLEMEDADDVAVASAAATAAESAEWKRYIEMKRTVKDACLLVEEAKKNANMLMHELTQMMTTHRIRDPSPLSVSPFA